MNDYGDMMADVDREMSVLMRFASPEPDSEMIRRVKGSVRASIELNDCEDLPGAADAMQGAKWGVRRELDQDRRELDHGWRESDQGRRVAGPARLRLWAPLWVAAAAAAFAFVTIGRFPPVPTAMDPAVAAFVNAMDQPMDDTLEELLAIGQAIDDLYAGQTDSSMDVWLDPVLYETDDGWSASRSNGRKADDS